MNLYHVSLYNHSTVGCTLPLEAVPVKQTLSLVNKSSPQLLSIETLAKIAPSPTPSIIHPPLLFRSKGICVAMDSVVMATNNYADVQEVEKDEGEGRAGAITGRGGNLASAEWRSSCDKTQGERWRSEDGEAVHHLYNDRWRSGQNLGGIWERRLQMCGFSSGATVVSSCAVRLYKQIKPCDSFSVCAAVKDAGRFT